MSRIGKDKEIIECDPLELPKPLRLPVPPARKPYEQPKVVPEPEKVVV